MAQIRWRNLDTPDEVIRSPKVVQNTVELGDVTVAKSTMEPGWRWSVDTQPVVGGEWCQVRHVGSVLAGALGITLPDGTETILRPGDVYDIPPGHDGWTASDEPCQVIEWSGTRAFLGFRAGRSGGQLVTLLFTDVVDSTAIARRIGDGAWRDRLSAHFEMARGCLQECGGREVATTGDGMLARFDGPVHAVRCAAEIARRAQQEELHIRAGVHVGEVEVVGGDVRGVAVNEAARVMGQAAADEILVSETTRILAMSSGLTFEDRGVHTLKGIGEARLFAFVQG